MKNLKVQALDSVIAVEFDESVDDDARELVASQWRHLLTDAESDHSLFATMQSSFTPSAEMTAFARGDSPEALAARIASVIAATALSAIFPQIEGPLQELPGRVGLQASALGLEKGAAVIFGGEARHSAVRELASSFEYLGSEGVSIDLADSTVTGIPGPLRLAATPGSAPEYLGLDHPGIHPTSEARPLRAFVFLVHDPEAEAALEPISIPEAVAWAHSQFPLFTALREPLHRFSQVFLRAGAPLILRYSDTSQIAPLLEEAINEPAPLAAADPTGHVPFEDPEIVPVSGNVRRAAMKEVIVDGQTMALCTRQFEVHAVSGISPFIWDFAASWVGLDELTERIVAAIGEPEGDAREFVSQAVDALVEREILVRV